MLSAVGKRQLLRNTASLLKTANRVSVVGGSRTIINNIRFQSTISDKGKVSSTNLLDDTDPNREHMFQYSWGTWLKNDTLEKSKRFTKFSIQGLNDLISRCQNVKVSNKLSEESNPDAIKDIQNCKVLLNNIPNFFKDIKEVGTIKQIVSLHEGKHHRVYRIEMDNTDKKLILRLPYTLHSKLFTKRKIESEVATMDFLNNMLNLNIPKVLSYSSTSENPLGHEFILMEYVEDVECSLMKKWNPLIDSENNKLDDPIAIEKLNEVIEPLADFNKIVGDFIFKNFGSIYFKDDYTNGLTAFENQDRWVIGPSVETAYYRNKEYLSDEEINRFAGPWKGDESLKMIKDLNELEILNLGKKLELLENGNKEIKEKKEDLLMAKHVLEKMNKISGEIFNLNSEETLIPNMEELIKPRLQIGDLDPMNVLIRKENKGYQFIDFENCIIKPFLISNYPKFIEYNGGKIFSLNEEIEDFENLDDVEKEQYKFMFKRTRNQFLWEVGINKRSKELVGVISPVIKLVKNPYINLLNFKEIKDYLYIENGLIEISTMWENYNNNGILGKKIGENNLIKFNEVEIEEFTNEIKKYEIENSSKPFIATNGWVPQDMFKNLQEQGMIIRDGENDEWIIDTDNVLK